MDKNPDWKKLYQDCKQELSHHNLKLVRLQKGLLKLSLGYLGRNQKFDKLLKLITKAIRANKNDAISGEELTTLINKLAQFTSEDRAQLKEQVTLEDSNQDEQTLPGVNSQTLAGFLQKIPSDLYMQAEIEILAGKVKLVNSEQELERLIDEAAILISKYCHSPTSESDNHQLIQLLENISFDKHFLSELNHTKSILTGKISSDTSQKASQLVADLINKSAQHNGSEDEVSDFLKKMTARLERLHVHLNQSQLIDNDHFTDSFSFSQDLDEQFDEIRNNLENSDSIASMKSNIETHLDFLNKSVSGYVEKEKTRMEDAEKTLGALSSQLINLQEEADVLKKSVEEEQKKSLTDPLTSIANRRAYEERLALEFSRWKRHGGNLSIMVFDLDKFKLINDNYGHVVGDKVLRGLTAAFQREIRETDFLARYGGEEFVMLMPETTLDETMLLADKLRSEVEQCVFRYQGKIVPVTVSIGAAEFREGDTEEDVFNRADQALYLAKKSGRNTCCSEEELTESV